MTGIEKKYFGNVERLGVNPNLYFELDNAGFTELCTYRNNGVVWEIFGHKSLCILATFIRVKGTLQGKIFIKASREHPLNLPKYGGAYILDYFPEFSIKLDKEVKVSSNGLFVLEDGSLQSFLLENCSVICNKNISLLWLYNYYRALEVQTVLTGIDRVKLVNYIKDRDIPCIIENLKDQYSNIPIRVLWKNKKEIQTLQNKLSQYYKIRFDSLKDILFLSKGK